MKYDEILGAAAFTFSVAGGMTLGAVFVVRSLLASRMMGRRGEPAALVKRSARSALLILAASAIVSTPFAGWEILLEAPSLAAVSEAASLALGLVSWAGLFVAFEQGGYFLIRHYLTRAIVWKAGLGPWSYVRFLDAATDRLLLRRVGGGHIFVHRALMEHLARGWHEGSGSDVGGGKQARSRDTESVLESRRARANVEEMLISGGSAGE
jgi:hypothetical protein